VACGYLLDSSKCQCTVCGVKLCGLCTFRTNRDRDPFTCIACLGEDAFYKERRHKAEQIHKQTEEALRVGAAGGLSAFKMKQLLFNFCQTVDLLNRLVMYSYLKSMWPLLLSIVQYQEEHDLEGHLGTLQAVRFHAEPRALHSELVQRVALVNARWNIKKRPPEKSHGSPKLGTDFSRTEQAACNQTRGLIEQT
jgi:hypothetical protein